MGSLFPKTLEAEGVLVEAMELTLPIAPAPLAATTEVAAEGVVVIWIITVAEVAPWALSVSFGVPGGPILRLTPEMSNHVDQP